MVDRLSGLSVVLRLELISGELLLVTRSYGGLALVFLPISRAGSGAGHFVGLPIPGSQRRPSEFTKILNLLLKLRLIALKRL